MPDDIKPAHVVGALLSFGKDVSSHIGALAFIGGVVWLAAKPYVDGYFDARIETSTSSVVAPLKQALAAVQVTVNQIEERVPERELRELLEFTGGGVLLSPGPFGPGDSFEVMYLLVRHDSCATSLRINFIDRATGRVDPRYSTSFPAVQVQPSPAMQDFVYKVTLPDDMQAGWYSYAPALIPDRAACPEFRTVLVPRTPFFQVVE